MRNKRTFSQEFKRQVVEELLTGESRPAQLCRRHNISSSLLYHWKKQYGRGKFNNEPIQEKEYLTDAFSREAVDFIERHKDAPFFLYLAYNAPHTPMEATPERLKKFEAIQDQKLRTYAAMVSALDDGVGTVLRKLQECGLVQDTLIFFLSDNGASPENAARSGPLRATKHTMFEGGIRVPFVMQWRGHIPAGKAYDEPVTCLDILPTAAAAASAELPKDRVIDGIDLQPYVTGRKKQPPHDILFWRYDKDYAVRRGRWKLVRHGQTSSLHDLANDVGESRDLLKDKPVVARELEQALKKWEAELVPPLWAPDPPPARQPASPPAT